MDIWHTCEPFEVSTIGWLGRTLRELDPEGENPLTGVNFGVGLPRAMAMPGVPVTSVSNLDNYGLMTGIELENERNQALDIFKQMYGPAVGTGPVMEYLSRTGQDVLSGADMIKVAPERYESERRVRGQSDCEELARRGAGPHRRSGNAGLLHAARRLRYARQRGAYASEADRRPVGRDS